jgi:hypothetical protein
MGQESSRGETPVKDVRGRQGVGKRYSVSIKLTTFRGHRGVWLTLCHAGDLPEAVYAALIPASLGVDDADARSVVRATFDPSETEALRQWVATRLGGTFSALAARAPRRGDAYRPALCLPQAGKLLLSELVGCPLPVPVYGYFDLRHADTGPFAEDC